MKTVGDPRPLTRQDIAMHVVPHAIDATPKVLRQTHHRVARLAAMGLRPSEIVAQTNYSYQRIYSLLCSPAMRELVDDYVSKVDQSFERQADAFYSAAFANMQTAEDLIADRLNAAVDEEGRDIPLKDLIAISADRADRFGYPKHNTSTNLNVDWAATLEKRLSAKRSEQT